MSLSKIEKVKKDRGFRIWDLIIYGAVLTVVAVTFIAVFATKNKIPLSGVRIYVNNTVVYEYDFTDQTADYSGRYLSDAVQLQENGATAVRLKITAYGGSNVVEISKSGSIKVTDADCSLRADCVYTPAITDSSGIIFCAPHRLKIVPYNFNPDDGNLIM